MSCHSGKLRNNKLSVRSSLLGLWFGLCYLAEIQQQWTNVRARIPKGNRPKTGLVPTDANHATLNP